MSVQAQVQVVVPRAPNTQELQNAIQQRVVDFNLSSYFKKGWQAFKVNFCQFWGSLIVYFLISALMIAASAGGYILAFGHPDFKNDEDQNNHNHQRRHDHAWKEEDGHKFDSVPELVIWVVATLAIMFFLVWAPMKSSFIRASFKALRTNSTLKVGDALSSFFCPYFCRLLWLTIVVTFLSAIAGGISSALVGFFGMFAYALHVDNDEAPLGVWHSLKFSTHAVLRHFCGILGFCVLAILLNFVGFITVFGVLITFPVTWFAFLFLYHDVIRINGFPVVVQGEMPLQQITVVTAPVVSVSPGTGYTQLRDDFQQVEGAC